MPHIVSSLNSILAYTWELVPFYKKKWIDSGIRKFLLTEKGQLSVFPFTTKNELLSYQSSIRAKLGSLTDIGLNGIRLFKSSGTTGKPTIWIGAEEQWQSIRERSRELFVLMGVKSGQRVAFDLQLGATLGPWSLWEGAQALGCTCLALGSFNETCDEKYDWLCTIIPDVLVCKTTQLLQISRYVKKNNIKTNQSGLKLLICSGSPGLDRCGIREELSTIWNVPIRERYGMTEAGPIAANCKVGIGLHILERAVYIECIDPVTGNLQKAGDLGELVVTTIIPSPFPLIRYRTGDYARIAQKPKCICGRSTTRILGPIQRDSDLSQTLNQAE